MTMGEKTLCDKINQLESTNESWKTLALQHIEESAKYRAGLMKCIDKLKITCMGNEYDWHNVKEFVDEMEKLL